MSLQIYTKYKFYKKKVIFIKNIIFNKNKYQNRKQIQSFSNDIKKFDNIIKNIEIFQLEKIKNLQFSKDPEIDSILNIIL